MVNTMQPTDPIIPVSGRSCGDCAMCCKLGTIQEVNKKDGEWCQHCSTRTRCDIYDTRPNVCRSYYCYYMLSDLSEDWRPTKAKLMVSAMADGAVYISVDPSRPDAWKKEPYYSMIRQWSKEASRVVVLVGLKAIAVYPDRIDELGMLDDHHTLAVVNETTPTGIVKRTVMVARPAA